MIDAFSRTVKKNRFGLVVLLVALIVAVSLITRISLLVFSAASFDFTFRNLFGVITIGLFFDLVNASYFVLPLILFLWLMPERIYQKKWHRIVLYSLFFVFTFPAV
jgi:hypothetical protein